MSDNRINSSGAQKTIYQSGTPMLTPIDPLLHKEAAKIHADLLRIETREHPNHDPLLHGPYAQDDHTPLFVPAPAAPRKPKPAPGSEPTKAQSPAAEKKPADPQAGVSRPIYTGGAPALRPDQMEQAQIDGNLLLKILYNLPEKLSFIRSAYMGITRVAGPAGAVLNLGYNIYNAKRILSDPKAPNVLKGGIVASTGLAAVSAGTAIRIGASTFGLGPMAPAALKSMGNVCGLAGLGAGTILSAMDTFNTFRDPNATPAEKGFSTLATATSLGLTVAVLMGVTGPIGIGLGIGAVAFTLFKGWLGKNKIANEVFGAIGGAAKSAAHAIGGFVKKFKFW